MRTRAIPESLVFIFCLFFFLVCLFLTAYFWRNKAAYNKARHRVLNDLVARAMTPAGFRSLSKEPQVLSRSDVKQPDRLTLIPSQARKPLTWDVTVVCSRALPQQPEKQAQ